MFSNKVIFVSVYLVGDFLVFKKKFYMYVGFCCWVLYIGYLYMFLVFCLLIGMVWINIIGILGVSFFSFDFVIILVCVFY